MHTIHTIHTNNRCLVSASKKKSLHRPIFIIGLSNVTSPQIARYNIKRHHGGLYPQEKLTKSQELVDSIIPLECPEKEDLEPSEYTDHVCHNTPGKNTSETYVSKISRFDFGTPEDWIIFVDLVQEALVGQYVTTGPPMYKCIERVLKGDVKVHHNDICLKYFG